MRIAFLASPFRWVCFLTVLCVVAGTTELGAASPEPQSFSFSWNPVPGAGAYLIEVAGNSGEIVYSGQETAEVHQKTLSLVPGTYRLRMTTLNRFMRPEASTQWVAIRVKAVSPPVFVSLSPDTVLAGTSAALTLTADNLSGDASAVLRAPSGVELKTDSRRNSVRDLVISLPPLSASGDYSLVITNPPDQKTEVSGVLHVKFPPASISGMEPASLDAGSTAILVLRGSNFSAQAQVFLSAADGKSIPLELSMVSDSTLQAGIPTNLGPGEYSVALVNTPGESPVYPPNRNLTLVSAPQSVSTATIETLPQATGVVSNPNPPPKKNPEHRMSLLLGWAYEVPLSDWGEIYGGTPRSAILRADYRFGPNAPLSFAMGIETGLVQFWSKENSLFVKSLYTGAHVGIGPRVVWSLPFMSLGLRAGAGIGYSKLKATNSTGYNTPSRESLDLLGSIRLEAEFPVTKPIHLGVSLGYSHLFLTHGMDSLSFSTFATLVF